MTEISEANRIYKQNKSYFSRKRHSVTARNLNKVSYRVVTIIGQYKK